VNPLVAGPLDPSTEVGQPACPCHDAADCPNQATLTIPAAELARLGGLLADLDAFLRCGPGVLDQLADCYAHRGHPHPRFAAATLVDLVCFTAPGLRHRVGTGGPRDGARR
jgi:hypothetical protein